ncbi:hypothetical protein OPV22_031601 [Ensete ventricosum]|uniref:CRAL/TRIO N-terminal domain-containing protein n=1 Tax=Ensete ventricosum TaxID=4639 RepID=A0AAV8PMR1_ENSVE|nr:hypothetical protein OPV22_031601 [Ensete ventricosum]
MAYSDEKVRKAMEFFTEKLSWTPDYVCQNPSVLSLSLEKRILLRFNFHYNCMNGFLTDLRSAINYRYYQQSCDSLSS